MIDSPPQFETPTRLDPGGGADVFSGGLFLFGFFTDKSSPNVAGFLVNDVLKSRRDVVRHRHIQGRGNDAGLAGQFLVDANALSGRLSRSRHPLKGSDHDSPQQEMTHNPSLMT